MASVIARRSGDRMLADLRKQLADVLTPERYDPERAAALQQAITEWLDRSARYRRARRAALTVANPSREWWY